MQKTILISIIFLSILTLSCSSHSTKYDNPATWNHFNIYAHTEDAPIFKQLQIDLGISPLMESYLLTVDLRNLQNEFVILGGENNSGSKTFSWSTLSKNVQDGLLKYTGSNKEKL
jgi:hypothetical protein